MGGMQQFDGYFQPLTTLTDSRRPIYAQHEVELAIVDSATLHIGSSPTLPIHLRLPYPPAIACI